MYVNADRPGFPDMPRMSRSRRAHLAFEPARIETGSEDENGVLILADGRLVAIMVRLDAPFNEDAQGCWHLEAGFGRCVGTPAPFASLSDGLRWVGRRLDELANLPEILAEADRAFGPFAKFGAGFWSRP